MRIAKAPFLLLLFTLKASYAFAPFSVATSPGGAQRPFPLTRSSVRRIPETKLLLKSSSSAMEKKVQGRQKRVKYGYRVMIAGHSIAALYSVSRFGGSDPFSIYAAVSGSASAALLSYILLSAARNNRLNSDTYKRLNLALSVYGILGVSLGLLQPATTLFWYCWMVLSTITAINSMKGFGYGVKGWKLQGGIQVVQDDIKAGILSTFTALFAIPKNFKSLGYLVATIITGTLMLLKLAEIGQLVFSSDDTARWVAHRLSSFSKLMLTTVVQFTLKDAADRDRLNGSTFIQLNCWQAVVYGCMAGTFIPNV